MKKTIYVFLASLALVGCSGARVVESTTERGTTLTTVRVSAGTVLTYNAQTGLLCVDAAAAGACKSQP